MLAVENITKSFSGIRALDGISLELQSGKVNAIIGENGAGKSTLMKILSGVYTEYGGRVTLHGKPIRFRNTHEAEQAGIAIIHQELNLIPGLSVTGNIFLGHELVNAWGVLDDQKMRARAIDLLGQLHLSIDPGTPVASLKVGQQQIVEIAKALLLDAEVLIMDEPTSAISESEVAVLFEIITQLKSKNKTIVYISHKLDEVYRIGDLYHVLRDGRSIESGDLKDITPDELIGKMVGREVHWMKKSGSFSNGNELFSVNKPRLGRFGSPHAMQDISLKLYRGEVLGIFGLMGAGRTELLEYLFGSGTSGPGFEITMEGKKAMIRSTMDAVAAGLALVPEDRKQDGLILDADVQSNICITTLQKLRGLFWLNAKKEEALAVQLIRDLNIKTSSPRQITRNLSGGNQQKIVLAKWLATKPKVLLLDEPTRGIDVHAKNEIYKLILELARQGMGIILVSSELPEILALSDRILVMAEGKITAEFPVQQATENILLKAAIPNSN